MDKALLEKIIENKNKKKSFCLVSQADVNETILVKNKDIGKHQFSEFIKKAINKDKLILEEIDGKEWIFNPFNPPAKLIIVGAVHVAQSLSIIAESSDFEVIIIDPREAFAEQERFPNNKVICAWPEDAFKEINLDERTAVVTLTHEPNLDDIALKSSLNSNCFYVGALGSKKTHKKRIDRFIEDGFSIETLKRINGPIGLPINAQTPQEIAISIMAEIISSLRYQKESIEELRENWKNR